MLRSPGLLDDSGHDLALTVDVLVVHHGALGLADPLQDDLLGGLRRDTAEVLGRHVLALHVAVGDVGPVDVELVVGDERVGALAGLDLERLQLVELALTCLLDQPLLHVGRELDREDAEVSLVVELDRRVARRGGNLLVGGEERVLERIDEVPLSIPFSRSISRTASMISWVILLTCFPELR